MKQILKNFAVVLLLLIGVVGFSGCEIDFGFGGDTPEEESLSLVGEYTYYDSYAGDLTYFDFFANNTFVKKMYSSEYGQTNFGGTYSMNTNTLVLTYSTSVTESYSYSITVTELMLSSNVGLYELDKITTSSDITGTYCGTSEHDGYAYLFEITLNANLSATVNSYDTTGITNSETGTYKTIGSYIIFSDLLEEGSLQVYPFTATTNTLVFTDTEDGTLSLTREQDVDIVGSYYMTQEISDENSVIEFVFKNDYTLTATQYTTGEDSETMSGTYSVIGNYLLFAVDYYEYTSYQMYQVVMGTTTLTFKNLNDGSVVAELTKESVNSNIVGSYYMLNTYSEDDSIAEYIFSSDYTLTAIQYVAGEESQTMSGTYKMLGNYVVLETTIDETSQYEVYQVSMGTTTLTFMDLNDGTVVAELTKEVDVNIVGSYYMVDYYSSEVSLGEYVFGSDYSLNAYNYINGELDQTVTGTYDVIGNYVIFETTFDEMTQYETYKMVMGTTTLTFTDYSGENTMAELTKEVDVNIVGSYYMVDYYSSEVSLGEYVFGSDYSLNAYNYINGELDQTVTGTYKVIGNYVIFETTFDEMTQYETYKVTMSTTTLTFTDYSEENTMAELTKEVDVNIVGSYYMVDYYSSEVSLGEYVFGSDYSLNAYNYIDGELDQTVTGTYKVIGNYVIFETTFDEMTQYETYKVTMSTTTLTFTDYSEENTMAELTKEVDYNLAGSYYYVDMNDYNDSIYEYVFRSDFTLSAYAYDSGELTQTVDGTYQVIGNYVIFVSTYNEMTQYEIYQIVPSPSLIKFVDPYDESVMAELIKEVDVYIAGQYYVEEQNSYYVYTFGSDFTFVAQAYVDDILTDMVFGSYEVIGNYIVTQVDYEDGYQYSAFAITKTSSTLTLTDHEGYQIVLTSLSGDDPAQVM
ncbi:MAG: hypothetical protein AB7S44_00310 [Spirochaetales bacterium]